MLKLNVKKLSPFIWILLCLLFAFSFAVVVGVIRPAEKINAIWLIIAAACFYILAYRFYGSFLAAKVLVLDDRRITPAQRLNDGKNFYPTNKWVLFGHHFAAIAGAGPLIGPVLATQFGYLPGFLWILIGAVVAGGVHDLVVLVGSMRRDGKSLSQIARDEVGPVTGIAAMIAILFIMIIAIAGLGLVVVNSLFRNPWGTFIIAMTIPIALFMGVYMKTLRPGKIAEASLIGIAALLLTVLAGHAIPGSSLRSLFFLEARPLAVLLAGYGFVASVLPVWLLLSPRDYLSSFMKIGVIVLLALGVIAVAPTLSMVPLTRFVSGGGPIIPGPLFPFLFITIACGALSGFHSIISSGTTPKMIERERFALPIGYGAMLAEGFVAVMAVIAASVLLPGDYFAINTKLSITQINGLGFPVREIRRLSQLIGVDVQGRPGGAVSLAVGMAHIFSSIPFLKKMMAYWYQFALMFEALFILTTIDAGTRVARYVVQEMGGHVYKPFARLGSLAANVAASFLVVLCWGYFIYTGSISTIWPMFGTANQLLGMLALCIGTTLLIKSRKTRYLWITLLPMLFMAAITFTAAITLIDNFIQQALWLNAGLMAAMVGLALIVLADSFHKWYGFLIKKRPASSTETSVAAEGLPL